MAVGTSVAGRVFVGGMVTVGVSEGVGDSSGVRLVPVPVPRVAKNTITEATMITTARIPIAAGRLSLISGMRLAWTDFSDFLASFCSGLAVNSVPHTRHRVAFSLRRVPQVGQTFVLLEVGSRVIRAEIIPSNDFTHF